MRRMKSHQLIASQSNIAVSREIRDQDTAKATSVDIKQLMNSIPPTPEQEITATIPLAEEENTPPPSPSDKELITIGNDDAPPLSIGESYENNCCCDLL